MALRVACPNGCRLQVPKSRAGMMVRCPKCKKIIKLADLSTAIKSEDGMDLIDAALPTRDELVELKKTVRQAADRSHLVRKSSSSLHVASMKPEQAVSNETTIVKAVPVAPATKPKALSEPADRPREEVMFVEPATTTREIAGENEQTPGTKPKHHARWRMPEPKSEKKRSNDAAKTKSKKASNLDSTSISAMPSSRTTKTPRPSPPKEIIVAESVDSASAATKRAVSQDSSAKNADGGNTAEISSAPRGIDEETGVRKVGVSHNRDAKSRAVFLTFALVLIGAFAIIPAISSFAGYVNTGGQSEIPRWAAWLVFLGVLHLMYAVYVGQLADWTSFWVVSIVMLILTAIMATLLAGMALSGQGGLISRVFQIPISLTTKAEIWLLTMLSITSLISYLSGREAFRWKKIENQLRAAISTGD